MGVHEASGTTTQSAPQDEGESIDQQERTVAPPRPALSIVIPAYNEGERIGTTLEAAHRYLDDLNVPYEMIVSNDGSRDETVGVVDGSIAGWKQARLIGYQVNRGKGFAVRHGVLNSHGDHVIFMDADLSTPMDEIPRALALLAAGNDVVIGSRSAAGARIARSQPLYRRWGARFFNQMRDQLLGLADLGDTQCGFKAYRGDVARRLFAMQCIERWMFDVEVLYLARRMGYRVVAMPVRWADVRGSKLRIVRDTAHMFHDLLRIRLWHRKVKSVTH